MVIIKITGIEWKIVNWGGRKVHFYSKYLINECLRICVEFPKILITVELDATGRDTILLFKLQDIFRNNLNSVSVESL